MLRCMSRWWLAVPVVLAAPVLAVAVGGSTGLQAIYLHIATNEPTNFVVQDIDQLDIDANDDVYIALDPDAVEVHSLCGVWVAPMQVDVWRQRVAFGAFESEMNREPNCGPDVGLATEMTLAALSTELGWRFDETQLYLYGDHSLQLWNESEVDGPIEGWLEGGSHMFVIGLIAVVALVVGTLVAIVGSRRKVAESNPLPWLGGAFVTGLVLAWALGMGLLLAQLA
jgi:hypothetical protein